MYYDIIIIGGGASGLCTAIQVKKENNSVLVIEHEAKAGKKLLGSGNGKCNLSNFYCKTELFSENPEGIYPYFSDGDKAFAENCISNFDVLDTIDFFKTLGMLCMEKDGYIYPRSEQAKTVLDTLLGEGKRRGVHYLYGMQPVKIIKKKKLFHIDEDLSCKYLVLSCGGMAAPKTGSDGSGYEYAKALGHRIISPAPALCGIICSDSYFKDLQGVRARCAVTLFNKRKKALSSVKGQVQFNKYGLSGIPAFQTALFFKENEGQYITLDLIPEISEAEAAAFIKAHGKNALRGMFNNKLASLLFVRAKGLFPDELAKLIKNFPAHPVSLCSFDEAQCNRGGVSTDEIDCNTMQSRLCENLYFTGEIMDMHGICGGYNLQWAWSSAHAAAQGILRS